MMKTLILSAAAILLVSTALHADLISEVPKASRADLAAGQTIVQSKDVKGSPWPELSLYQVVNAPPKVVAALFSDYAAAPSYIPGMLAAKLLAENADGSKDIEYTVKMPILQKISYSVRNTYAQKGQTYEVDWTLLKSPLAKSSDGSLRIEPYGNGATLLCYNNLVVPITSLVAGLKNQALTEAKSTVNAIKTESEKRAAQ